jgi:hypothetical protein
MAAAAAAAGPRQRSGRARRQRPDQVLGAGAGGAASGRVEERQLPLLESLAELLGVPPAAAAEQLLGMDAEARWQLRRRFAEGDDPSLAAGAPSEGEEAGEDARTL